VDAKIWQWAFVTVLLRYWKDCIESENSHSSEN
jgi:hypothetical protein